MCFCFSFISVALAAQTPVQSSFRSTDLHSWDELADPDIKMLARGIVGPISQINGKAYLRDLSWGGGCGHDA